MGPEDLLVDRPAARRRPRRRRPDPAGRRGRRRRAARPQRPHRGDPPRNRLPDTGDDEGFDSRNVRLATHFRGAGKLDGDLTPECAAALRAVLDSLAAKGGPEDIRTAAQRQHDALAAACHRLISGGLPDRAGQPTQIHLHMSLSQLLGQPGAADATADWAGHAPAAGPGADCDAAITPIVTAHLDPAELDDQTRDFLHATRTLTGPGCPACANQASGARCHLHPPGTAMAHTAARGLILARAIRLLSGPGGLAAHLRGQLLPQPAASISLPLDLGQPAGTVPASLRRAIAVRDKHCRFPGCDQFPAYCQVHHLTPVARDGPTSLENCCLACLFHHQIAIHKWGWQLHLNPDGTTTARLGNRTLYSHAVPAA